MSKVFLTLDVNTGQAVTSVSELRKNLKELKKQLENTNPTDDIGAKKFEELKGKVITAKKELDKFNAEIRTTPSFTEKLSEAFGKTFDNSLQKFSALSQSTGLFAKELSVVQNVTNAYKSTTEALTVALFGQKAATEGGTVAMRIFKVALASTGIGLLVTAIASLVQYFTATERGSDQLAQAMAFLKGAFTAVRDVAILLGEKIVQIATSPKKAFTDLVNFIEQNVINRFKAFTVIFEAMQKGDFKGVANGVIQLTTGITDATGKIEKFGQKAVEVGNKINATANKALEIERQRDKLEDDEIRNLTVIAELEAQISERRQEASETLDKAEKQRLLTEAKSLIEKKSAIKQDLADRKAAIEQGLVDLGESTNEEIRIAEQAKVEAIRIRKETADEKRSIDRQLLTLEKGDLQELAKAEKEAVKERVKIDKELSDAKARNIQDASQREIEGVKAALQNRLSEIKGSSEKEIALREELTKEAQNKINQIEFNALLERTKQQGLIKLGLLGENTSEYFDQLIENLKAEHELEISNKNLTDNQKLILTQKYNDEYAKLIQQRVAAGNNIEQTNFDTNARLHNAEISRLESLLQKEEITAEQRKVIEKRLADERIVLITSNKDKEINEIDNKLQQIAELEKKRKDEGKTLSDSELAERANLEAQKVEVTANAEKAITDVTSEEVEKRKSLWQQGFDFIVGSIGSAISSITSLTSNSINAELQGIDAVTKKRLQALNDKEKQLKKEGKFSKEHEMLMNEEREKIEKEAEEKKRALKKKQFEADKRAKFIQAGIDMAVNIVKVSATPWMIPIVAATGLAQMAVIASAPTPEFAAGTVFEKGTVLNGKSHAEGGLAIIDHMGIKRGEVEGDEILLNKNVKRNPAFFAMASMMNEMTGGRKLDNNTSTTLQRSIPRSVSNSTPIPRFAEGAVFSTSIPKSSSNNITQTSGKEMAEMVGEILKEKLSFPIRSYVLENEITESQSLNRKIEDRAKF